MNCCQRNAASLPTGSCDQGRQCPERNLHRVDSLGGGNYWPREQITENDLPGIDEVSGWLVIALWVIVFAFLGGLVWAL